MNEFVLIIFLSFFPDGGVGSERIYFKDNTSCESARIQIYKNLQRLESRKKWRNTNNLVATCIKTK